MTRSSRRQARSRRTRGYLLLEVLIGGVMVATGLASLLVMTMNSKTESIIASRDSTSQMLTSQRIEEYRGLDYANLPGASPAAETIKLSQGTYTRTTTIGTGTVTFVTAVAYTDIDVSVTYTIRGQLRDADAHVRIYDPN